MTRHDELTPTLNIEHLKADALNWANEGLDRAALSRRVCIALFHEHGIHPTASLVREITNKGSMTDIARDLRSFWSELREKSKVKIEAAGVPADILTAFGQSLSSLWDLAVTEALNTMNAEREALAQEKAEQAELVSQLQERVSFSTSELEALKTSYQSLNEQKTLVEIELAKRNTELELQIERNKAKEAEWTKREVEMNNQFKMVQDELSSQLTALNQTIKTMEERYDADRKYSLLEIEAARQKSTHLESHIRELKMDYGTRENMLTQHRNKALSDVSEANRRAGEAEKLLAIKESEATLLALEVDRLVGILQAGRIKELKDGDGIAPLNDDGNLSE